MQTAYFFDARSITLQHEERILLEALQGIANQSGPNLLVIGSPWDDTWKEIYSTRHGFTFQSIDSLPDLFRTFKATIKGLVVYDDRIDASCWVAVTLAGLDAVVPVNDRLLDNLTDNCKAYPGKFADDFAIRHDFRGRWKDNEAPYQWLLQTLAPRCNRKVAHSAWELGFDYAVMQKGIVFNLSPAPEKSPSYGGVMVGGHPEQTELFEQILKFLDPPAQINGYGVPEGTFCALLSKYGHFSFLCGSNASFHTHIKSLKQKLKQRIHDHAANTQVEKKHYVAFMLSEGDTMKAPLSFAYGSWFDPERGHVPMNYGVNPMMGKQFPAMLEYYFDTATDDDYFFAGVSGAGYAYPDLMPSVKGFAACSGKLFRQSDIMISDIWHGKQSLPEYARIAQPDGFTCTDLNRWPSGFVQRSGWDGNVSMLPGGVPVIFHQLGYWQAFAAHGYPSWQDCVAGHAEEAIDWLIKRIDEIETVNQTPSFIIVYSDLHNYDKQCTFHKKIAARLSADRFKVVRLDEMMAAAKLAYSDRLVLKTPRIVYVPRQTEYPVDIPLLQNTYAVGVAADAEIRDAATQAVLWHQTLELEPWEEVGAAFKAGCSESRKLLISVSHAGQRDNDEAFLNAVPLPEAYRDRTLVFNRSYTAIEGSFRTGSLGQDAQSPAGYARTASVMNGDAAEYLFYGPFRAFSKDGTYIACFSLKSSENTSPAPTATIDVYDHPGLFPTDCTLGSAVIKGTDFRQAGEYQWFFVPFEWNRNDGGFVEFRVFWHGTSDLALDQIVVFGINR